MRCGNDISIFIHSLHMNLMLPADRIKSRSHLHKHQVTSSNWKHRQQLNTSSAPYLLSVVTMWGKKTASFYFCNSFVRTSSITTIFGTCIFQ